MSGVSVIKRILGGIADFLQRNGAGTATLMPYNPLWLDKATRLGQLPKYDNGHFMSPRELQRCVDLFRQAG